MESILTSIKKLIGISQEDKAFDADIIMHINSVFMTLNQLGVGPDDGFVIANDVDTWAKFLGDSSKLIQAVKTYTYLKVKMVFDPPASSSALSAMQREADTYEWRIAHQIEMEKED